MVKRIANDKTKVSEVSANVGRPKDEDKTKFGNEEKEYINFRGKGIGVAEAAEKAGIAADKACRLEQNPNVQAQIKERAEQKELNWTQKEELLYEKSLDRALEMIAGGKASMKDIRWWVERFEAKRGIGPPDRPDGRIKGAKQPAVHPQTGQVKGDIFAEQEVEE